MIGATLEPAPGTSAHVRGPDEVEDRALARARLFLFLFSFLLFSSGVRGGDQGAPLLCRYDSVVAWGISRSATRSFQHARSALLTLF